MQITVTIPDEVVSTAESLGLTPERYVEELIAEKTSAEKTESKAERETRLDSFFKAMSRYSDKIPLLPDEAFSRESIYRDHD